ncbi:Phosphomannomutase; alpha-phosphoglucomutase [groundwater metagenome]|uniref:Phosphomannomutase alpha-phosphoglucomutase n=1 Tax=groundwater metagenome TaxID=717931 RepID=A0A098E959_9ZZZZ
MVGKLFGTTGIRGTANDFLTPEFCSKIASVFGNYLNEKFNAKNVIVGMDPRTSSDMIRTAVISGLLSAGCDVYDSGITSTPSIQYAVKEKIYKFDAGIMITGSHIPIDRNGLKFFMPDGNEVYGKIEEEIEELYFSGKFKRVLWNEIGKIYNADAGKIYKEMLLKEGVKVGKENCLKIVVDTGHGAQSNIIPFVLRELGHKVITLNAQMDGFFPGRPSEPDKKNLENLMNVVKVLNADLGMAFDGDGDRSIFVDDKGEYVMGDIIGAIIADYLMKEKDVVVTGISTSAIIDYVAEKKKGKVIRTKVGAADVVGAIMKNNAIFGFEENGGSIFPTINLGREGGLTAVKILKILHDKNKKLSEIIAEYPKFYQIKEKIQCRDELKNKLTLAIKEKIKESKDSKYKNGKIDETDGIKILFGDGWILFRPSWTEPIYRIFAEGKSERIAAELIEFGRKISNEALKGLIC